MHSEMLDAAVSPVADRAPARLSRISQRWLVRAAALGVMLFGLFLYLSLWAEPGSPVVFHGDRMMASGRLQQVLDDPALGGREEGPSVGAGFTDKAGRSCRPFAQGEVDGTACRINGDWHVMEMRQR